MKRLLFFLLIGTGLLAASCTKRYEEVTPNETVYANVKSTDWATSDTSKTFTTTLNSSQIDKYFANHGAVIIYFTFDGGKTYEAIPETYNNTAFSYIYTAGGIELYAQSANGAQQIVAPSDLTVKMVLVPSN